MSLPPMIRSLLDPGHYPGPPSEVRLVQTHISFVIVAGDLVYKIKKPVGFGFLDYTTLEKRLFYCGQEVELNRRLSSGVYLGVTEIRRQGERFGYGGEGEIVDYAVTMRRLPEERKMSSLLTSGAIGPAEIERIARRIAAFHAGAGCGPEVEDAGGFETVKRNVAENFDQTEKYLGLTIDADDFSTVRDYSIGFLAREEALFLNRMAEGRVKDCHGDLHMEHVYLMNGDIEIIDCIEFNDRFRCSDVTADVAFLAMDLDFAGRRDLSAAFIEAYEEASGDRGIEPLVNFFKCYRAFVRGKVDSFELDDPNLDEDEKLRIGGIASKYFRLASSYAGR